jgi:hypothetical protein
MLGLLYPIGAIFQGWLGDQVGLRVVTVGSGLVMAAVMLGVRVVRPGFTKALAS